ncbi:glycosyltransferase family A protein [uncultured Lacinutrix sp.]|uniref:glycosyltransferase family A protein n=1 Tax=uncultured Lacinutrix sp. TaxID=574032 RepID=UPI00263835E7|nr:glycosyltransferase family A protein [uncultured Lacinutrix sp.]
MKTGIIIIFHNNEKHIDTTIFIKQLSQAKDIQFCLVNNASKDNTILALQEIKEARLQNVSVVDIRKFKSDVSAVRAGARFMFSQFNLKHLGYVSINLLNINYKGLNSLIKAISENHEVIVDYNAETLKRRDIKLTLFQSLFSVIEYLKKIKVNNQFIDRQCLTQF